MNQPALPLAETAEPSTVQHLSARAEVHREGAVRVLVVAGIPLLHWSDGDEVGERYAMVLLVRLGFATQIQVAKAVDVARMTVHRWEQTFEEGGISGLQPKRGRQGPTVLRDAIARQMLALKEAGLTNVEIAIRLGVTEAGIRKALLREGYRPAVGIQPELLAPVAEDPERGEFTLPAQADLQATAHDVTEAAGADDTSTRTDDVTLPVEPAAPMAVASAAAEVLTADHGAVPVAGVISEPQAVLAVTEHHGAGVPPAPANRAGDGSAPPCDGGAAEPATPVTSSTLPVAGQAGILLGFDPWDRSLDRGLAKLGLISEAEPQFGDCQSVAGLGVLLALPALVQSGMLEIASQTFMGWKAAFYGVRTVFLCLALMALQRIRNPERLRHHSPADLGRVLGLDRAPEVKTLRAKVEGLSAQRESETFMRVLAKRRVETHPGAMGFLYVDGHVRVYNGKTKLDKMHVTRQRLSMPATADHWVNDRRGDPLLVLTGTPTASLAKEALAIALEVRQALGPGRRATIIFDRGGWSPALFAALIKMEFDILTYRKGQIPKVRRDKFTTRKGVIDGQEVSYRLAERTVRFKYKGGVLKLREVVRLSEDGEHQTSMVTSRWDLGIVEVAYRMFGRWRQENYFKYMEAEFAIDALWTYGTEEADPDRDVPNPRRKVTERALAEARAEVANIEREIGAAAADNDESKRPTMRGFKIANAGVGKRLRAARQRVNRLSARLRKIPKRVTAAKAAKGTPVVRLKTEAKRLTDTVKSVAYQAETALFRMVRPHYARAEDEGRKLIASAMDLPGDIQVAQGELRITLAPAASPNRTRAIAKLCEELTATRTLYPGTQLRLSYAIREA